MSLTNFNLESRLLIFESSEKSAMNFIGDIVEKEVKPPSEDEFATITQSTEKLSINKKPSLWKQRLQAKKISSTSSLKNDYEKELEEMTENKDESELTEKEKIHLENLKYFASMSPDQLAKEREELMESIDPKILNALMKKSKKGDQFLAGKDTNREPKEEPNDAFDNVLQKSQEGNGNSESTKKSTKKVRFDNQPQQSLEKTKPLAELDENDIVETNYFGEDGSPIPTEEKLSEADQTDPHDLFHSLHFPKNPKPETDDDYKIDLHDPDFMDKLHEKYFPELPKETEKLKWMQSVEPLQEKDTILENEGLLRFDFDGNIIVPDAETIDKIPISSGLYHHSDSPQLPGYTLKELADLSRSRFSPQRSIAIRTLGRILHKLGLHKYDIIVSEDEGSEKDGQNTAINPELKTEFEKKLWTQVQKLQIVPSLMNASDENLTRNLSVRNYAIDALWLWKQSGGDQQLLDAAAEFQEQE